MCSLPLLAPGRGRVAALPRLCFLNGDRPRRGWPGAHKGSAGSNAKGSPPRPAAGSKPARALQLYFLWLSGALLIIYFFSLFYFYFQVAGRTGCRPFTPLPWSKARRRPEPTQAQLHRPPGRRRRRRLLGRAQPGRGGWGSGSRGSRGTAGYGGRGEEWQQRAVGGGGRHRIGSVPGCAPAWLGQHKFSSTGSSSPVQSPRDLAVIIWLS